MTTGYHSGMNGVHYIYIFYMVCNCALYRDIKKFDVSLRYSGLYYLYCFAEQPLLKHITYLAHFQGAVVSSL